MCGIAGAVSLSDGVRPDPGAVQRMLDCLAHRGPDGEGLWTAPSGRAVLGHRRLAVIDVASGAQPMLAPGGAVAITLNGEIYNFVELRRELEQRGVLLRTHSDTEVLLQLLLDDGDAALNRLQGMFAFGLWDDRRGRLLLARDRMGEKPLFHAVHQGILYFASSVEALLRGGVRPGPVDLAALDAFLDLGYVPAPRTMYTGVGRLPAGSAMTVQAGRIETMTYWSPSTAAVEPPAARADALDRLDELVTEAVRIQLRSDVPLGVFLSGGVDSSLVAALAAKVAGPGLRTFSIRFAGSPRDESAHAARVAAHLGTVHLELPVEASLLDLLPSVVGHFGEPFGDATLLPTWVLAEAARQHVTVALGGDGGDEGFAGYAWYQAALRLQRAAGMVPRPVQRGLGALAGHGTAVARRLQRGLARMSAPPAKGFALARSFMHDADVDSLYDGELLQARHAGRPGLAAVEQAYAATAGEPLRQMRAADIATALADGLLPKVDVTTMAHALELRAPLLDVQVIEFALGLPARWLLEGSTGKVLLRELLYRYVPRQLVDRPKQGFDVPVNAWLADDRSGLAVRLRSSETLRATGWIKPAGVERLIKEQLAGVRDHEQRLFSLLTLDEWLRQHDVTGS